MSARTAVLVHQGLVSPTEQAGYKLFAQPEYPYSFDLADKVTFALSVLDVQGSASSWYLKAKFQVANPNASGFQFAGPAWADLQTEQVQTMIAEGVTWYGGAGLAASYTNLTPRPSETFTDWNAVAGTGGAAAATTVTTGGFSGANFRRVTWSTGTSAVSGGVQLESSAAFTPTEGLAYSAGISVRSSIGQRVQFGIDWMDGSDAVISSGFASGVVLVANTWTRLSVLNRTAPAGAVLGRLVVKASAGTGGVNWSIGDTLDADAALTVQAATLPLIYFDGGTTDAAWTGSANASTSIWTNPGGIVATSGDALPVTVLRTLRDFGSRARVVIQPVASGASADFAVRYSLTAHYRIT